eukprot:7942181-Pyramimonas_sp.AAC.1
MAHKLAGVALAQHHTGCEMGGVAMRTMPNRLAWPQGAGAPCGLYSQASRRGIFSAPQAGGAGG